MSENNEVKTENAVDAIENEPVMEESSNKRRSRKGTKRISMLTRTAQEGEAILKGLGHTDEAPEGRRTTRSSTRGATTPTSTPLPPAKKARKTPAPKVLCHGSVSSCLLTTSLLQSQCEKFQVIESLLSSAGRSRGRGKKSVEEEEEEIEDKEVKKDEDMEIDDTSAAIDDKKGQNGEEHADEEITTNSTEHNTHVAQSQEKDELFKENEKEKEDDDKEAEALEDNDKVEEKEPEPLNEEKPSAPTDTEQEESTSTDKPAEAND